MDVPKDQPQLLLTVTASQTLDSTVATLVPPLPLQAELVMLQQWETENILSLLHLWNKGRGEVQVESQLRQVPRVTPTALSLHWVPTLPRWLLKMGSRTGNTLYRTPLLPSPLLGGRLLAPG